MMNVTITDVSVSVFEWFQLFMENPLRFIRLTRMGTVGTSALTFAALMALADD